MSVPRASDRGDSARSRRRTGRPALVVALLVVLLATGTGVAWAAGWISAGAGSSTARAGSARPPTATAVAGSAVTTGLLYPTATGAVVLTVTNPNPYPVRVTRVAGNGAATGSGGIGACDTTGVTIVPQNPGTALAAGASATLTVPGAAAMSSASDSGCQNAVFTVPVTVTIEST